MKAMTVKFRDWDSAFFGVRIFQAHVGAADVAASLEEAGRQGAECLYLFIELTDPSGIEAAVRAGGRLVDIRVELTGEVEIDAHPGAAATRRAVQSDREVLMRQALQLAHESRFARDARIPLQRVNEMYEIWIERCLSDGMIAVPVHHEAGFVGVRPDGPVTRIELVHVEPHSRGQGLGTSLIRDAVSALGVSEATVVTQIGNVGAQRLYQSLGLRSSGTAAVIHVWLDELA
jgi:ribosomal protein S18 acetylase RimI-like enzyme